MNNRNWWPSRIQCCIDHIKTAMDVDPWAKELAEELLTACLPAKKEIDRCGAIPIAVIKRAIAGCNMAIGCDQGGWYEHQLKRALEEVLEYYNAPVYVGDELRVCKQAGIPIDWVPRAPYPVRCKECWKRGFDNCPFNEFSEMYRPDDDFYCAEGEAEPEPAGEKSVGNWMRRTYGDKETPWEREKRKANDDERTGREEAGDPECVRVLRGGGAGGAAGVPYL